MRVMLHVLRLPDHTTNNALNSGSASNVLSNNKEKLGLEQTLPRNRLLTVNRHVVCVLTFVSGLDHSNVLTLVFHSCHAKDLAHCTFQLNALTCIICSHNIIKRVLPAPLLETATSVTSR